MANLKEKIKVNWKSGLTVSLVSLPLSIALSVASWAWPLPWVIASVWWCLIASIFGGSKYNVVWAAWALTTLLSTFAAISTFTNWLGTFPMAFVLPFVAILTWLVILVIWAFKFEKYLIYVPSSVMYWFAAWVAITIAFSQLNDMLWLTGVTPSTHFVSKLMNSFDKIGTFSLSTFIVFVLTFGIILFLKRIKFVLPWVVVVAFLWVIFGMAMAHFGWDLWVSTLTSRYPDVVKWTLFIPLSFSSFFDLLKNSDFIYSIIKVSVVVALIAVLETLITAKLADSITGTKFNRRKEMLGLALANMWSGFAGGLPTTWVFVRTGLNIKTGANNSISSTIASVATGILTIVLFPFFKYIPMAVIAWILFNTALGLIEFEKFEKFWKDDKKSFLVSIVVAVITIFEDPSIWILLWATLALLFFADKLSRWEFEAMLGSKKKTIVHQHWAIFRCHDDSVETVVYSVEGILVYLDASSHFDNLEKIANLKNVKNVVLRMRDLFYVDIDWLDILEEAIEKLIEAWKNVTFTMPRPETYKYLKKKEFFKKAEKGKLVFQKTRLALDSLGY